MALKLFQGLEMQVITKIVVFELHKMIDQPSVQLQCKSVALYI